VLEGAPAVLIFVPILLPVVRALHIDVVHRLTIVVSHRASACSFPWTGVVVHGAASAGSRWKRCSSRSCLLAVLFVGLLVLIAFPDITTVVPKLSTFHTRRYDELQNQCGNTALRR
jgi:TRAP-type C4-dicarboxylate transport system permease large subunit